MRRYLPELEGVPQPPTRLAHLRTGREYGKEYRVRPLSIVPVLLIELYQRVTVDKEHVCNFRPSCSEYSRLAYIRYGAFAATALTLERIKKCHIFTDWPEENKP